MHTTYRKFLSTIVPSEWYAKTEDKNGNMVYFTAQQFKETLNQQCPDEEAMMRWDYSFQWQEGKAQMQWYECLDHPAMTVLWIHKSVLSSTIVALPDTTLPDNPRQLGERVALIKESASLDTENDYTVLRHRCVESITPRYWSQRWHYYTNEPGWNTPECIHFCTAFTEEWIATYADASVRRMKALAQPVQQFVTIG